MRGGRPRPCGGHRSPTRYVREVRGGGIGREVRVSLNEGAIIKITAAVTGALGAGLFLACSNATEPTSVPPESLVLVAGSEIEGFDPSSGAAVWSMSVQGMIENVVLSPDGRGMLLAVNTQASDRSLMKVDLCSLIVEWRLPLLRSGEPNWIEDVGLSTGEVMATDASGGFAYLWRSWKGDTLGIALVDLDRYAPSAFSGPWDVRAGGISPPSAESLTEPLAIVASRHPDGEEKLYFLNETTLEPIDSVSSAEMGETGEIWSVDRIGTGEALLIGGDGWLALYDRDAGEPVASATRPAIGAVHVAPSGNTVLLTDAGVWPDSPGSGLLHVFGAQLSPLGIIDVSTPVGGVPGTATASVTWSVAFGDDGQTAYVLGGTIDPGPLYPSQPTRIFEVDLDAQVVSQVHELPGREVGALFYQPACPGS